MKIQINLKWLLFVIHSCEMEEINLPASFNCALQYISRSTVRGSSRKK